jgi:biopolymer transport protein ExbD
MCGIFIVLQLDAFTQQRRVVRISLTPLIDVVFILLLFFMLTTSFVRWNQMSFASAAAGDVAPEQPAEPRQLWLSADNRLTLDSENYFLPAQTTDAVPDTSLQSLLNNLRAENTPVLLTATPDVPVQTVVDALDVLTRAGVANVHLTESQER